MRQGREPVPRAGEARAMNIAAVLSRREALACVARAAVAAGVAGCASITGNSPRRYGWEAAAALPPGPYRAQIWRPPGPYTAPIFVVVLVRPGLAPPRILESDGVVDRGEVQPATIVADLRARYPALLPGDVEVEPLAAGGDAIGYVIRTRNIDVYAYLAPSLGLYWVKLSGVGKYRRKGGGGGR